MGRTLRRWALKALRRFFSERTARKAALYLTRSFVDELRVQATKDFLHFLLMAMDVAFCILDDFRQRHLDKFKACYVFETATGGVKQIVTFSDNDMHVQSKTDEKSNVRVTFRDPAALRDFLFSSNQDILDQILNNTVEVHGNVNYVYKFGYMARDLQTEVERLFEQT